MSTGIATRDGDRYPRMHDLIAACDKALDRAKNGGRNRTCADVLMEETAPANAI